MRFNPPPQWPLDARGWMPEPGWEPEGEWPEPPKAWSFWVNDYGVPVDGPAGLYGARSRNRARMVGAGFFAFVLGWIMASCGSPSAPPSSLASLPAETVTQQATTTVTHTLEPAEVTVTEEAETATETVEVTATETVEVQVTATETVEVEVPVQQFVDTRRGGGGDAYYDNCDAVRAAGASPLYAGQPGYRSGLDRDNDGVACE